MNEPFLPHGYIEVIAYCSLAQTGLLLAVCFLFRHWVSKLNRKLHRIETNTRHTVQAVAAEQEEVAD